MPSKNNAAEPSQHNIAEELTLGQYLRNERERRTLSVEELHRKTGIQLSVINALENDRRHELPADVFVRGFIKLYAKALDLDPQYALALYQNAPDSQQKKNETLSHKELLSSETLAESPLLFTRKKLLFALLVILLLGFGYALSFYRPFHDFSWRSYFPFGASAPLPAATPAKNLQNDGPPAAVNEQIKPAAAESEMNTEQQQLESASHPAEERIEKEAFTSPAAKEIPEPRSASSPGGEGGSRTAELNRLPEEMPKEQTHTPSTMEQPSATEQESTTVQLSSADTPSEAAHTLSASFSEMTWVRVVIDDNEVKEAFFRPGDSATWQADKKIEILLGNSGGATLNFDGKPVKLTRKSGRVSRLTFP